MTDKSILIVDTDFLSHIFGGSNIGDGSDGIAAMDQLAEKYDIRITSTVYAETDQPSPYDVRAAWFDDNNIVPITTPQTPGSDGGEKSIKHVLDNGVIDPSNTVIASNDANYFGPGKEGAVYGNQWNETEDIMREALVDGTLNQQQFDAVRDRHPSSSPIQQNLKSSIEEISDAAGDASGKTVTPAVDGNGDPIVDSNGKQMLDIDGQHTSIDKVLKKLGVFGTVLSLGVLINDMAEAAENCDYDGMMDVLKEYIVSEVGAVAGAAIVGGTVAKSIGSKIPIAGIPGLVAKVAVTGVGIAGSIYGESQFAQAYDDFGNDMDDSNLFTQDQIDGAKEAINITREASDNCLDDEEDERDDEGDTDREGEMVEGQDESETQVSPLILDLDQSGTIDLHSITDAHAYFDLDADGYAENTGWIDHTSGDGFLVWDQNDDNIINNISELFGNVYAEGFQELALLDSNADGKIDSSDTNWSNLEIWVDANGNGYTEDGELHTLASYNIASISLTNTRIDQADEGNFVSNLGSFTYTNQTTGNISDVWFGYDNWNSVYNDEYDLDLRAIFMPTIRGYGDVADLHIAMSLDNGTDGLLEKVLDFSSYELEELVSFSYQDIKDDLTEIMHMWAGVDGIDPSSRGDYVDARDLTYIEKMTGKPFLQSGYNPNPQMQAGQKLTETFFEDQILVMARLSMQTAGAELFNGDISYELNADELLGVGTLNTTTINDLVTLAQTPSVDALDMWTNVLMIVSGARGKFENLTTADINALDTAITASDPGLDLDNITTSLFGYDTNGLDVDGTSSADSPLSGSNYSDHIDGKGGHDTLYGHGGDDYIATGTGDDTSYGGDGHDIIYNYSGDDTFYGGAGADLFESGTGSDTYVFNQGDGDDTIVEKFSSSATDILEFGAGITLSDLSFTRLSNEDLLIEVDSSVGGGSITIDGQFGFYAEDIDEIVFADSSTFDIFSQNYTLQGIHLAETLSGVEEYTNDDFDDTIYGNGGNDTITGLHGADNLYGGDGDDTIYAYDTSGESNDTEAHTLDGGADNDLIRGADGVDTITGGTGNDVLYGYSGNDTYHFDYGDGVDHIYDDSGTDKILFGAGVSGAHLSYDLSVRYDLTIIIDGGAGGSITIDNIFDDPGDAIETAELSDSTVLDLINQDYEWSGSEDADTLYGRDITGTHDTIHALGGDDYINGEQGDDIIYGGDGDDDLYGDDGDDELYGGAGADYIRGGDGTDILSGGDGNDDIRGDSGDDILSGGLGDDYISGGGGDDTVDYSQSAAAVIVNLDDQEVTGQGTDDLQSIEYAIGSDYDDTFFTDDSYVDGGAGSDTIDYSQGYYSSRYTVTADLANGTATGYGTNDTFDSIENLIGGDDDDIFTGNSSINRLEGGEGDDTLSGAAGDDILIGGDNADTLTGGADADTFVFKSGETGIDTITDFSTSDNDALDLSDILSAYDPMSDLITDFVEMTTSGSDSLLKVDTDGGADSFVQIATLTGITGLTDEAALETNGTIVV